MTSIHWPAVVKLDGVEELLYMESAEHWTRLVEWNVAYGDRLIDAQGHSFTLECLDDEWRAVPMRDIELSDWNQWVRNHLVAMQQCCVYKVELESFTQGLQLVRDTQESN